MQVPDESDDESFESVDEDFVDGYNGHEGETPVVAEKPPTSEGTATHNESVDHTDLPSSEPEERKTVTANTADGKGAVDERQPVEATDPSPDTPKKDFRALLGDDPAPISPWFSSFLKSASNTVVNLKTSVAESARLVIESVDTTLGAPDPKELALQLKHLKLERERNEGSSIDDDKRATTGRPAKEAEEHPHYVNKLASFLKTPDLTTFVSTGLDALETVGRKTIDVLRTDRRNVLPASGGDSGWDEGNPKSALPMLLSRTRITENAQVKEANLEMDLLTKSSTTAARRIHTECVRNPHFASVLERLGDELEITEKEKEAHPANFDEAVNAFEQAMQSASWSLTLDWSFISKILTEAEGQLSCLESGCCNAQDMTHKCVISMTKIRDASLKLFNLLSKELTCASACSVKSVALSLSHILTVCAQSYARLIKRQFAVSNSGEHSLTDLMADVFFKESELNTDIETGYSCLQECIKAQAIVKTREEDAEHLS